MARRSFRDRFLTPQVARAMLSPSGILLAGAGAAVVVASGLPLIVAPFAAAGAWGARVLAAMPRDRGNERSQRTLPEPWRGFVHEAEDARTRFQGIVDRAEPGPVQDRLRSIAGRIDDGVDECWRVARHGAELATARHVIDADSVREQLAGVEADASLPEAAGTAVAKTADSLRAQLATADRLDRVIIDARDRLRLLDARLDESVARALELSVQAGTADELGGLGDDIDLVVSEMESLRQGLEETTAAQDRATGTA